MSLLFFATGCSQEFTTPIEWGGAQWIRPGNLESDPARIRLSTSGVGYAYDFPDEDTRQTAPQEACLLTSRGDRYTGPLEWSALGRNRIEVRFSDKTYVLEDGYGRLGSQSWGELRLFNCGETAGYLQLYVVCGNPGPSYARLDIEACEDS